MVNSGKTSANVVFNALATIAFQMSLANTMITSRCNASGG